MKGPMLEENCCFIDVIDIMDDICDDSLPQVLARDPLEEVLCGNLSRDNASVWGNEVQDIEKDLSLKE